MTDDGGPRDHCRGYCTERGCAAPALLSRGEFDRLCEDGQFSDGPFKSGFGDGHGEPYNPYRQAFGTLKDGRVVYCELHASRQPTAEG